MRILAIADIHGNGSVVQKLENHISRADLVVVVGDITHFGKKKDAIQVLDFIRSRAKIFKGVTGNCDFREVDDLLDEYGANLHSRGIIIGRVGLVGLGGSLVTPFDTPNEYTEDEIAGFLEVAFSYVDKKIPIVLVSHQPPYGTKCDRIRGGTPVGSKSIREFIERRSPRVCICGHIHESVGIDTIGDTVVVNPGPLSAGRFAVVDIDENQTAQVEIMNI